MQMFVFHIFSQSHHTKLRCSLRTIQSAYVRLRCDTFRTVPHEMSQCPFDCVPKRSLKPAVEKLPTCRLSPPLPFGRRAALATRPGKQDGNMTLPSVTWCGCRGLAPFLFTVGADAAASVVGPISFLPLQNPSVVPLLSTCVVVGPVIFTRNQRKP